MNSNAGPPPSSTAKGLKQQRPQPLGGRVAATRACQNSRRSKAGKGAGWRRITRPYGARPAWAKRSGWVAIKSLAASDMA